MRMCNNYSIAIKYIKFNYMIHYRGQTFFFVRRIYKNNIKFNLLNNNGIIITHSHKNGEDKFPEKFNIIEKKTYGISKIIFGSYF